MKKPIAGLTLLALAAACGADVTGDVEQPGPVPAPSSRDPGALQALHDAARNDRTEHIPFTVASGLQWVSPRGVRVSLPPNCIGNADGVVTSGDVTLTYVELIGRENMFVTGMDTTAVDANGELQSLRSAGTFYFAVDQEGARLLPSCTIRVDVAAELTGAPVDPAMQLFYAEPSADGRLVWNAAPVPTAASSIPSTGGLIVKRMENGDGLGEGYAGFIDRFGWANFDRFIHMNVPKADVRVSPPTGYDDTNSLAFMLVSDEPNVLRNLNRYVDDDGAFVGFGAQLPIDLPITLVFSTVTDEGQWAYAVRTLVVAEGAHTAFVADELLAATEEELVAIVHDL